jgi:hypothetical protein
LLSLYAETPAAAGQRAHAKLIFQGYLKLVVFTMQYAETTACALQRKGIHQQQARVA